MLAWLALASVALAWRGAGGRELDPAACAARFDVQRDKIIRTEESRDMGARYLSELDVGARHECRRLCCETDACDVFVYEEKSPGSCYLFSCGPPADFRCKFTAHGNFSIGVLSLSRPLLELQDQERLPPPPAPPAPLAPLTTTTTTSTPPPPPPPPPIRVPAPTQPPPPAPPHYTPHTTSQPLTGRCSRYQWECHSGGECIAVYNACDGVPQCADGSDEAPELGCPAARDPARDTAREPARVPPLPRVPPHRHLPPPPPAEPERAPVYPAQVYELEGGGAEPGPGPAAEPGGERWPHRLLQAQPRRYPDQGEAAGDVSSPHIFSHAGGLVQQPPPHRQYNTRTGVGVDSSGWGGWGREWDERRAWPAAPPPGPVRTDPEMPAYLPGGSGGQTMPELPAVYPAPPALHDAPKKGPRPHHDPPPPPQQAAAPAQPQLEQTTQNTPVKSVPAASSPVATTPAAPAVSAARRDEDDGLSERPPAAVLMLVIGVAMTGAMGVLVGCRARAARRRLRRGGKPFAHDADYLVNGMYL